MKKLELNILFGILILTMNIYFTSCNNNDGKEGNNEEKVELTISAAASLKDVMESIKTEFNKENENIDIVYNFASSGSLQQQIEQGAKVDVFISAATKQMDALAEKDLIIESTRRNFLENEVVLVITDDFNEIDSFDDLSSDKTDIIAIGEPESVPAGKYAKETLESLNLYNKIESKLVFAKDVREVLTWVETGNAEAGIVYSSDALTSDKVKIINLQEDNLHEPIYYPAAVIKDSDNLDEATEFVNYLYDESTKPIFEEYGFEFIEE
jgi:molybdate transport system substrate-binding protein